MDFSENLFSLFAHDVTFRLLIEVMILCGYSAKIADVETVFLHRRLEEEIYMDCPPGMMEVGLGDVHHTKNVNGDLLNKHVGKLITNKFEL